MDQFVDWSTIIDGKKNCYLTYYNNNNLTGFCIIKEKLNYASVQFGPLVNNPNLIPEIIEKIFDHYKKKKFGLLRIQLDYLNTKLYETILTNLNNRIDYSLDKTSSWSTKILELNINENEIFLNFSKNHKRSIKKAIKLGLITSRLITEGEVDKFSEIFIDMYKFRKISSSIINTKKTFKEIFNLIKKNNLGFILGVFDKNKNLLGGIIVVFQGKNAFYYYGASSPKYRKFPILHLAFFDSIKICIKLGLKNFDFGGYDKYGGNQMEGINRFKDGFSPKLLNYPHALLIKPNYISYLVTIIFRKINKLKNKLKALI